MPHLPLSTGLLSVSLIAYQLVIIQLLSLTQWNHFAGMVISVALLGFGAAATVLSLFKVKIMQHSDTLLPVLMITSGVAMILAPWISQTGFLRFDSYLLFVDRFQWLALLFSYLLYFLPFFFGALALGIVFVRHVDEIGRYYFFNLLGSAFGGATVVVISWYFHPATLPAVIAIISILAGLLLTIHKRILWVVLPGCFAFFGGIYKIIYPVQPVLSQYKSISRTLNLPAAEITFEKPGPFGLLQVVKAEGLRYAPGVSLAYTGEVPVTKVIFNNGDWVGPVGSTGNSTILDFTTQKLPYVMNDRKTVLELHAGTGMGVAHALRNGAGAVDVVESHLGLINVLKGDLARETDFLFHHPSVRIWQTEPRTFIMGTTEKYDLIQLPVIGSFGGTAGLYAMREEYTFTKESFHRLWDMLNDDGVISITAWMDYPFKNPLKIIATLAETLEEKSIREIDHHLLAIRSWGTVTFVVKKSPVTGEEIKAVREFCDSLFFDPLFLPGVVKDERSRHNHMMDTTFFSWMDDLLSAQRDEIYADYDFHIRPATDDKPFFSQYLRWRSLPYLKEVFGSQSVPFLEMGFLVTAMTFVQISALAIVLIILPLFRIGWGSGGKRWLLMYFAGIGMGYMLLEIVLIQQFMLFFGSPVYAVAFIIGIMLLASGAGSYSSSIRPVSQKLLKKILGAIAGILLLYAFFLSSFLHELVGFTLPVKVIVSVIVVGFPSFLMGVPFPVGMQLCALLDDKKIPWAWGINSCSSVISAALASLLAVEVGFTWVVVLSGMFYILSLLSLYFYPEEA